MNYLKKCISEYKSGEEGKAIYKHQSFASIYNNILSSYQNKETILVEIGIGYGGCLQMWKKYFGKKAQIYGIDNADRLCYEEEQIQCFVADQANRESLKKVAELIPLIDIFIDDGGHISRGQIATFEEFFPHIKPGGLYICEDTHTSYRETHGGGYKKEDTFIEYCKGIIDALYYNENPIIPNKDVWQMVDSISFYRAMIVIKKIKQEETDV